MPGYACNFLPNMAQPSASRMCDAFVLERNANASLTMIAAHQRPTRELVIVYALDDVRAGVPLHIEESESFGSGWLTGPVAAPHVRCNGKRVQSRLVGCRGMCRVESMPANACEQLTLELPALQLRAHSKLCAWGVVASRRPAAMACSYVFVPPATENRTLQAVVQWASLMSPQVSQLHLHVLNRGEAVRRAVRTAVPQLLERHKLVLHVWNWVEAFQTKGGRGISSSAHEDHWSGTSTANGLNPYHARDWALTKGVVELRDQTDWLMIMDVDESFGSASHSITLQGFFEKLHPQMRQYGFCEVDRVSGCRLGDGSCEVTGGGRSKSAVRLSSGCAWWPGPHYSIPLNHTGDAADCELTSATGKRFGAKGVKSRLDYFRTGLGCHPRPPQYIVHDPLRYSVLDASGSTTGSD